MSAINCLGCGSEVGQDGQCPRPEHCGNCPPWDCDECGQQCSISTTCGCWIFFEGMNLADIKAVLAAADLSVNVEVPPCSIDSSQH
ncbi:hypothetical protein MASS_1562 [Mycobacteroides abscessus subsp. bolletii 50594]|uniref:Bacteriophage protein n=1 Tax=Mycobacteroides abscessus subsp. bolletii 50594 TaxID=1303024 RepID=A0AB33A8Z4_9MYCO|nr:hypothetical protein MASS_1562 [Mycobacteroides abscessus subsp. bolletii 50594]